MLIQSWQNIASEISQFSVVSGLLSTVYMLNNNINYLREKQNPCHSFSNIQLSYSIILTGAIMKRSMWRYMELYKITEMVVCKGDDFCCVIFFLNKYSKSASIWKFSFVYSKCLLTFFCICVLKRTNNLVSDCDKAIKICRVEMGIVKTHGSENSGLLNLRGGTLKWWLRYHWERNLQMFHSVCIRCKKRWRSAGKYKIGLYKVAYFSHVLHGYRFNTKLPHCVKERLHKRYHNRPEAMISIP